MCVGNYHARILELPRVVLHPCTGLTAPQNKVKNPSMKTIGKIPPQGSSSSKRVYPNHAFPDPNRRSSLLLSAATLTVFGIDATALPARCYITFVRDVSFPLEKKSQTMNTVSLYAINFSLRGLPHGCLLIYYVNSSLK